MRDNGRNGKSAEENYIRVREYLKQEYLEREAFKQMYDGLYSKVYADVMNSITIDIKKKGISALDEIIKNIGN